MRRELGLDVHFALAALSIHYCFQRESRGSRAATLPTGVDTLVVLASAARPSRGQGSSPYGGMWRFSVCAHKDRSCGVPLHPPNRVTSKNPKVRSDANSDHIVKVELKPDTKGSCCLLLPESSK